MDKDKEAIALFQNKRQEIRCSQLVNAVNKEQSMRERELLHETHHFETKLWKLVQKRKELRLDPARTRELEVFLNPGLRSKVNMQSNASSPNKLEKIIATQDSKQASGESVPRENTFVTSPSKVSGLDQGEDFPVVGFTTQNFSKYPVLPATSVSDSSLKETGDSKPKRDIRARKEKIFQRSVSEMNFKIGNSKQWLPALPGCKANEASTAEEKEDVEQSRTRQSHSFTL